MATLSDAVGTSSEKQRALRAKLASITELIEQRRTTIFMLERERMQLTTRLRLAGWTAPKPSGAVVNLSPERLAEIRADQERVNAEQARKSGEEHRDWAPSRTVDRAIERVDAVARLKAVAVPVPIVFRPIHEMIATPTQVIGCSAASSRPASSCCWPASAARSRASWRCTGRSPLRSRRVSVHRVSRGRGARAARRGVAQGPCAEGGPGIPADVRPRAAGQLQRPPGVGEGAGRHQRRAWTPSCW